jgi:multidrug efflux pump subunit AcrA (membrane-fusion protein)
LTIKNYATQRSDEIHGMEKSTSPTTTTSSKSKLSFIKKHPGRVILVVLLILLVGAGSGLVYSNRARQAAAIATQSAPQTATVRQGTIILSAGGSGTLAVSNEIDLAFATSGQVTGVFVKPGDHVEVGTLLAQINDQESQTSYSQAKQAYQELTSAAAIATAQQQLAQAQTNLMSAKYDLEYLISPEVYYWETEIANGEQTLKEAETSANASPSDKNAQKALQKAKDFLGFAQDKLKDAWKLYYKEYVPETFRLVEDRNDKDIYAVPSDLEIQVARTAIDEAQKKVNDSQDYYNALTGGPLPKDASSDALTQLQQAELDYKNAQTVLDGTKIIAPITGTILSVATSAGNTADTGTFITMADTSQLELDIYLDPTDWNLATVGDKAEVTFDGIRNKTYTGKISELDAELYQSNNTSTIKGIVQLDTTLDKLGLPIGASASVNIIHAQADNVLIVPVSALHETAPGKYEVFLFENGTLTRRVVEVGLQDQAFAEVKSGLKVGDVVSTSPVTTD